MDANKEVVVVDDMRELDEDMQNELLEAVWPFPLRVPDCNTTGIECAVLVLRRMFREMPTDSHCRGTIFGQQDQTTYKLDKDKLDHTRALFRYAWHHLPDLDVESGNNLLRLEVTDRQRALLRILLVDYNVTQSRLSFEALMESESMLAAFWGAFELQTFRNVVGWQARGESRWQAKERSRASRPVNWKLDKEPSLENIINKGLGLREVTGGNTSMLLPSWPTILRVRMTSSASVSVSKLMEQKVLNLKGYELLAEAEDDMYKVSDTQSQYTLIAAVFLRPSGEHNDVVYTFDSKGGVIASSLKKPVPYESSTDTPVAKEAMVYFSRVKLEEKMEAITIQSDGESEDDMGDRDDRRFRERLKALDPAASTGFTPLSREAEQRLPENIVPDLKAAKTKFFS